MASRMKPKAVSGEALGLKLLQSVREMKVGKAARVTHVELTEVAEARQASGLSQSQFAEALLQADIARMGARTTSAVRRGADADSHCKTAPRGGEGSARVRACKTIMTFRSRLEE